MTFLDTGFLFALVSKRDAHHSRVVEVFRTLKDLRLVDHLLTTNHVIAETITLTRKVGHEEAARLGDQLYGEKLARIHWATPDCAGSHCRRAHVCVADRLADVAMITRHARHCDVTMT